MNKLQMAHDWAMKHGNAETIGSRQNMIKYAWEYADAMQAEADKREKTSIKETQCNHKPHGNIDGCDRYICKNCKEIIDVKTNNPVTHFGHTGD